MRRWSDDTYFYAACMAALPAAGLAMLLALAGVIPLEPCWFFTRWGVYCPGCGGTRAVLALLRLDFLRAAYYHPPMMAAGAWLAVYLPVQTVCRLRGRQTPSWCRWRKELGWVLLALLAANCLARNLLWLGFHVPI